MLGTKGIADRFISKIGLRNPTPRSWSCPWHFLSSCQAGCNRMDEQKPNGILQVWNRAEVQT